MTMVDQALGVQRRDRTQTATTGGRKRGDVLPFLAVALSLLLLGLAGISASVYFGIEVTEAPVMDAASAMAWL
ncbi:MAG: hypothetical protein WBX25_06070 [Rhodomicrobium sp.]